MILEKIALKRAEEIKKTGHTMGFDIPEKRNVPIVPFVFPKKEKFLICEIKRSSPSRGIIDNTISAYSKADEYIKRGVSHISVLTEKNYFSGSLKDLIEIKRRTHNVAVLRKDFLFDKEDIDVSFRAGADAVLLIAKLLSPKDLYSLYFHAKELGMEALVEVHDREDLNKVRKLEPSLTGINSRNLRDFSVDITRPLKLKKHIDWKTTLVFESGIHSKEDAHVALAAGFSGLLVGEAVVKDIDLIDRINTVFPQNTLRHNFWGKLYQRKKANIPLVKICGITREDDARMIVDAGADILGFIFAPSPRRTNKKLLERIKDLDVLKVAVVVTNGFTAEQSEYSRVGKYQNYINEGLINAVQFHGSEKPEHCYRLAFPYYKAVRVRNERDIEAMNSFRSPRVLVDAYSEKAHGGTGKRLSDTLIRKVMNVKPLRPLWLAGGVNPDNVAEIIRKYRPELIDLSSGVESEPGKKDPEKIKRLFREIRRSVL